MEKTRKMGITAGILAVATFAIAGPALPPPTAVVNGGTAAGAAASVVTAGAYASPDSVCICR